jgi:hypothetical protein
MIQYFELFDIASFLLFAVILYFLSSLSKRLGEVMGLKKYYYLYYIGIFFILFASIIMILSFGILENGRFYGYVSFSIGMTLSLIAAIKYWGWLIKELFRG